MTKIPSTSHGLTHPTTQNINLLHVRAGAPKEKLRYPESDVSDPVSTVVGPDTQAGAVLTILAIDLGTTTGWAMRARDHQIAHGFVSLKPQRFEGGGMRFLRFKRWLSEIHTMANDIHAVYFEEVRRHEREALRHSGAFGMSVDQAYRGQGIGRRLLEHGIAEARSWPGFCRLELGVTPWNVRAIALYESLGFVLEARKAKAINLRGQPEDDLLMALVW